MEKIKIKDIMAYREIAEKIDHSSFINSVRPEIEKEQPAWSTSLVADLLGVSRTLIYTIIAEEDIDYKIVGKTTKKITSKGLEQLRNHLERKNPDKYKRRRYSGVEIAVNSNKGGTGKSSVTSFLSGYLNLIAGLGVDPIYINSEEKIHKIVYQEIKKKSEKWPDIYDDPDETKENFSKRVRPLDGKKKGVLIVDFDAQFTITSQIGFDGDAFDIFETSYALLTPDLPEDVNLWDCVHRTSWEGIDLIPASLGLYGVEFEIPVKVSHDESFPFWRILSNRIKEIAKHYSVVIYDCPPSLNFVSINTVFSSNGILMPCLPSQSSYHSLVSYLSMLSDTLNTVNSAAEIIGEKEKVFDFLKVVVNKHEESLDANAIVRKLQATFEDNCLFNPILNSRSVEQAVSDFRNVYEITPKSKETHQRCLSSINSFGKEVLQVLDAIDVEDYSLEG